MKGWAQGQQTRTVSSNKLLHVWSVDFWQRRKGINEERTTWQIVLEQLHIYMLTKKRKKISPFLVPYVKMNTEWIIDLTRFLKKKRPEIRKKTLQMWYQNNDEWKTKLKNWTSTKLKPALWKTLLRNFKKQASDSEKMFTYLQSISDKEVLLKLRNKKK